MILHIMILNVNSVYAIIGSLSNLRITEDEEIYHYSTRFSYITSNVFDDENINLFYQETHYILIFCLITFCKLKTLTNVHKTGLTFIDVLPFISIK